MAEIHEPVYARVRASFGPHASRYTASPGHADAAAVARLVAQVAPRRTDRVLDLGTGAGHAALAFAPAVAEVVALDLTPEMLAEVERNAARRALTNVTVRAGAAESLPFGDADFDVVVSRLATHHFAALPRAVEEMARVLAPGGQLAIVDTMAPEDDALDEAINLIETIRDPSHVRNWRPSEWESMVEHAGLTVTCADLGYYDEGDGMDLAAWTERIGTPAADVARLCAILRDASDALAEVLRISVRGDEIRFALPRLTLIAAK